MQQEERTQRSRALVLQAALKLFSSRGFRATSVRDIAAEAGVSTGNVYHHFRDKDAIFQELLDQYWRAIDDPDFPVNRAIAAGAFPDNLEELGRASRESVRRYRPYVALIYVDVVEFEGKHIRKFYSDMAKRFETFLAQHRGALRFDEKLRPGVSPVAAIMLAGRFFIHYFSVEILFGVPNQFGLSSDEAVRAIADILRHGMLRQEAQAKTAPLARIPATVGS